MRNTMPDNWFGKPTARKYVRGALLPCYYVGIWRTDSGHWMYGGKGNEEYHVWRPIGNRLSSWVRLEPTDGKRASMLYDPGKGLSRLSDKE